MYLSDGSVRKGQVLEIAGKRAVVQVNNQTFRSSKEPLELITFILISREFTGQTMEMPISEEMLGRAFNGSGTPIDKGPPVLAEKFLNIQGQPINPCQRVYPE